jgi:predicted chitinase
MIDDRALFFRTVSQSLFDGRLSVGQVAGIGAILDAAEDGRPPPDAGDGAMRGDTVSPGMPTGGQADAPRRQRPPFDPRWLAYMLATVHHETGRKMQSIRETGAASDALAIERLDRAFENGRLPGVRHPYWRRDASGKSWLGRGLVQLTHRANYETLSRLTGVDLLSDPGRALDADVAVKILFAGMTAGAFTGRGLGTFFNDTRTDWIGARQIINGRDRAAEIAALAQAYHAAIGIARRDADIRALPVAGETDAPAAGWRGVRRVLRLVRRAIDVLILKGWSS